MSQTMKNLLTADAPAARDTAFEIAVLGRIEQRRFRRAVAGRLAATLAACILLALAMPGLAPMWDNGVAVVTPLLPRSVPPLAIGLALMAASAALPWLRRAD